MSLVSRHLIFAESKKSILPSTLSNALLIYNKVGTPDWVKESIQELVHDHNWKELNDRFYKQMSFGTGGIRGRTIGNTITSTEEGIPTELGRPQHPAVGTNTMNEYNLIRAVKGLCRYVLKNFQPTPECPRPRMVFAHDTRHFSREFAEMAARVVQRMGVDVSLFESERSTPELSFALRHLNAHAGGVITASHNPAHDNGFKVYYSDGAQIVDPHASGIIDEVNAGSDQPTEEGAMVTPGEYAVLGAEIDDLYVQKLLTLLLDAPMVQSQQANLKIVYSPLHGTGVKLIPRILSELGFSHSLVEAQSSADGRFPTVSTPNPEYPASLKMAIEQAESLGADLVVATDPDTDRMGAAARDSQGELVLLSGNQIASLIAFYRTHKLTEQGVINGNNAKDHAALIKTVVTTDLLKSIATHFGVKIVETLTGFKYIAEKLGDYEQIVLDAKKMTTAEYSALNERAKRDLLLKYSTYYIFGGEESYGYSASDFVRDKDANAAVLMFCETAAFAKAQGLTLVQMLDDIYMRLGFFSEILGQITLEGAEGAQKIKRLLASYAENPPAELAGRKIVKVQRFDQEDMHDVDGKLLPKELMYLYHFEDGGRVAVRGSGTEPKVKYYLFAQKLPRAGGVFTVAELALAKSTTDTLLKESWKVIEQNAQERMA